LWRTYTPCCGLPSLCLFLVPLPCCSSLSTTLPTWLLLLGAAQICSLLLLLRGPATLHPVCAVLLSSTCLPPPAPTCLTPATPTSAVHTPPYSAHYTFCFCHYFCHIVYALLFLGRVSLYCCAEDIPVHLKHPAPLLLPLLCSLYILPFCILLQTFSYMPPATYTVFFLLFCHTTTPLPLCRFLLPYIYYHCCPYLPPAVRALAAVRTAILGFGCLNAAKPRGPATCLPARTVTALSALRQLFIASPVLYCLLTHGSWFGDGFRQRDATCLSPCHRYIPRLDTYRHTARWLLATREVNLLAAIKHLLGSAACYRLPGRGCYCFAPWRQ